MKQSKPNRIFIIGHSGAGKGVLAKAIAEKLNWKLIDADFGLEIQTGLTLQECIGQQGEEAFHHSESKILTHLFTKQNIVVTTDAAIVCSEKNRQLLSSEFVVYLKVNVTTQLERLSRFQKSLLESLLEKNDIRNFLEKLHQERDELYSQSSKLFVDSDDNDLDKHVEKVISFIDANQLENNKLILDDNELIFFHKKLHKPVRLSNQQALCLKLMAQGKTSKEIAREINISYRTVEAHIAKAMEQLGCSSSKELISLYFDK